MNDPRGFLYSLIPWGTDLILWVQSWRTPWLDGLLVAASLDPEGVLLAAPLPVIYWCIDRFLGVELVYLNILAQFATGFIKIALAIPRPSAPGIAVIGQMPDTYSFPSGHVQVSVTVFGYLALRARKLWLRLVLLSVIPLVCLSRVYLGVHFPQDVVGGILVGVISIGLFRLAYPPVRAWADDQRMTSLLVVSVASAAIPLILGFLLLPGSSSIKPAVTASGLLAGVNIGLVLMKGSGGFSVRGSWGTFLLRLVVGLLVVAALYGAAGLVETRLCWSFVASCAAKWLRCFLVGWGLVCGAPWLFEALGLNSSINAAKLDS